jgi:hypothetical protein
VSGRIDWAVDRAPEHRFDNDVRQVPDVAQDSLEPFPGPVGEGPGGDAA